MVHKKPDRRTRRELRRASRPPSTMTRKAEVRFYVGLVVVALIFAAVILFAVS